MSKDRNGSGGISFIGLLQVAFIVLKLCHVIDWTWFWVLSPTWIGAALVLIVLIAVFIVKLWRS